jgi:hypothetical protein
VDVINWISVVSGIIGILGFVFAIWVWMRSDFKVRELQDTLDFKVGELRNTLETVYETCGTILWETRFLTPEDKDARLSQLDKSIGLVSGIRTLASRYSENARHGTSELELLIERGVLWSLEMLQRIERSADVREVWLITHDLEPDLNDPTAGSVVSNNLKAGKSYKYFFPENLDDADAKMWQLRENVGATSPDSRVEFFPVADRPEIKVSSPANVILFFKDSHFYATDLVYQEVILTKVSRRGHFWQEHDPKHARQVLESMRAEVHKRKRELGKLDDQSERKQIPPSTT